VRSDGLHDGIELIVWKGMIQDVSITLIYHEGYYYACLQDINDSEQCILDARIPDLATKGRGYLVKNWKESTSWLSNAKLMLWQTGDSFDIELGNELASDSKSKLSISSDSKDNRGTYSSKKDNLSGLNFL